MTPPQPISEVPGGTTSAAAFTAPTAAAPAAAAAAAAAPSTDTPTAGPEGGQNGAPCTEAVHPVVPAVATLAAGMPPLPPYLGYRGDLLSVLANVIFGRPDVAHLVSGMDGAVELLLAQVHSSKPYISTEGVGLSRDHFPCPHTHIGGRIISRTFP